MVNVVCEQKLEWLIIEFSLRASVFSCLFASRACIFLAKLKILQLKNSYKDMYANWPQLKKTK